MLCYWEKTLLPSDSNQVHYCRIVLCDVDCVGETLDEKIEGVVLC